MSNGFPLVTIGIPTYNRPDGVARALASALAQNYSNLEIIVSDNASPGGIGSLADLCGPGHNVRVIRHAVNIGAEANFRAVLSAATGEYFLWLCDDDWLEPNYVSECVTFLLARPDYSLVAGRTTFYRNDATPPFEGSSTVLEQPLPEERVFAFYDTVYEAAVFYGVFRREQTLSIPFRFQIGADWHMVAALAATGKIMTLDTTRNHRSANGLSGDLNVLANRHGIRGNLHRVIARDALAEIIWRTKQFRTVSFWRRVKLGFRVYLAMYERWCMVQHTQPSIRRRIDLKFHRWALAMLPPRQFR